ncbi:universal stress protein [Streptomyces piniterrae]|uniref:Universal stress protein n=1 Tax=Streptomyces piniterrae TaxID=2571125 RepID=A0A4U0NXA0_9ACTN|nr:universal stress protein [Streptomyces piniterrae]TJZ59300.1 universal stress protein [Streptomyces piniterrae]
MEPAATEPVAAEPNTAEPIATESVVTVGLDGSPESLAAARWAAREAERRQLTVRLLHAWILLSPEPTDVPAEMDQNYWARRIVGDAQAELQGRHPGLSVTVDLVAEEPATALLRAAVESQLLVLGSRGLESVESYFLGDVSMHVVARAERPVVLVRVGMHEAEPSPVHTGGVVVGLGLRGPCDTVLDFAFAAAVQRGVPLKAVHGRSLPVQAFVPWGVDPDVSKEIREEALGELGQALRPWRDRFPDVAVTEDVRLESAARAIVGAAEGADLLVIGRRRHRAGLTPRIGPAAHAAVHHAPCPVAVVPHD